MATYNIDALPSNYEPGDIINCPYSGTIKSITLPKGTYKFELWGGGTPGVYSDSYIAYGGYTEGNYSISNSTTFYLVCGGAGSVSSSTSRRVAGGYNGGGSGCANKTCSAGSGGGATHIAKINGLLSTLSAHATNGNIVAVAGGAGGGVGNSYVPHGVYNSNNYSGGGGSSGNGGGGYSHDSLAGGGTQSYGGAPASVSAGGYEANGTEGSFGQGGTGGGGAGEGKGAGGGGGYYGGGGGASVAGYFSVNVSYAAGGGGSGYCAKLISGTTSTQTTASPSGSTLNGYIRITVVSFPYDFSAVAGTGVSSALASPSSGVDGDSILFTCVLTPGYEFDGWYNGGVKVSSSQSYTHIVNGADLSLTAVAVSLKTITAAAGTGISGATVNGASSINVSVGTTVTFNCILSSDDDWAFDGWFDGSTRLSTSQTYNYTVTDNKTITAVGYVIQTLPVITGVTLIPNQVNVGGQTVLSVTIRKDPVS